MIMPLLKSSLNKAENGDRPLVIPALIPASLPPPLPRTRPRWPAKVRQERDPDNGDLYLGVAALRAAPFRRELRHFGIDPDLFARCLEGDLHEMQSAQRELSSHLLGAVAITAAGHAVANKTVISPSLVGFLIQAMLDALQRRSDSIVDHDPKKIEVVDELSELIKSQLVIGLDGYCRFAEREKLRNEVVSAARLIVENGSRPTVRSVAAIIGVDPSTISRMFPRGSLVREAHAQADAFARWQATRARSITKMS